jgi:hypothetical protein
MNNEISIYNKVSDPLIFVQQMGSAIARSRLFGCESEDQGKIFAWYCVARQRDPFEVAAKHHIIDGNLSKKADAMLAEFRERGGKHLIISYTSELACLELTNDSQTMQFSCSWEEAKAEPWPYKKDGKTIKTNWATPRAKRSMLWARAVSDGVRRMMPEINCGTYTPEEIADFTNDDKGIQEGNVAAAPVVQSNPQQSTASPSNGNGNGQHHVEEAEFQPAAAASQPTQPAPAAAAELPKSRLPESNSAATYALASQEQIRRASSSLAAIAEIEPDIRERVTKACGGRELNALTGQEIEGLIIRLREKAQALRVDVPF